MKLMQNGTGNGKDGLPRKTKRRRGSTMARGHLTGASIPSCEKPDIWCIHCGEKLQAGFFCISGWNLVFFCPSSEECDERVEKQERKKS